MYTSIKILHMTLALISVTGFAVRGLLRLSNSSLLQRKALRVLPHALDTLLLLSALVLVVLSGQYPFVTPWVTAKLLGLIAYIGLGVIMMRVARTRGQQLIFFILALLTAAWIFHVALSKQVF